MVIITAIYREPIMCQVLCMGNFRKLKKLGKDLQTIKDKPGPFKPQSI